MSISAAYIKEMAVYLAKGNIRQPKRNDWENVIKICKHNAQPPLDAKTLGEGVMLAQEMFKNGITDAFMAQAIKDRIGGLKPAEEFIADWEAEEATEIRKNVGKKKKPERRDKRKEA